MTGWKSETQLFIFTQQQLFLQGPLVCKFNNAGCESNYPENPLSIVGSYSKASRATYWTINISIFLFTMAILSVTFFGKSTRVALVWKHQQVKMSCALVWKFYKIHLFSHLNQDNVLGGVSLRLANNICGVLR